MAMVRFPSGHLANAAVLALLAIYPGQVLSSDRIIDEIWAGSPPPSALKTLHAYVSRLRRALQASVDNDPIGELLLSRNPGYVLAINDSQIDAVRFERMVADASSALGSGQPDAAADGIREAMSLWRGTALADFAYEPFAATESQRLMERRIEAVELRIDADLALARHTSLVAELEGLVAEYPMRERLWAQLMTALYRCGRQADALGAYGRVRHALIEELGIEPGPELRLLERQVLEQSDQLAWQPVSRESTGSVATPLPRASGVAGSQDPAINGTVLVTPRTGADVLPFVGRDTQLDRLAEIVSEAPIEGIPRLAFVMGEAGCGKSRLLDEFKSRVTSDRVLAVTGLVEHENSLPYGPFAEMVRGVLDATGPAALERVGHLRADLAWLLPELGPRPSVTDGDLGTARARLAESILQLLARAGSGEPLLLLVDDAHRIDEGAVSLLHTLLNRRWARPVVVVLAYRTEAGGRRMKIEGPLVDLLGREGTTIVEVGRLSEPDLAALISRIGTGAPDADPENVAVRLRQRTAGIPLLVREVLASATDIDGAIPDQGGRQRSVTPLVSAVIGHRLNELSNDAVELLEVAAVIGQRFDVEVLAAVTEQNPTRVTELLEEALQAGIVVETGELDVLAFDHGLVRDVAAGPVSASRQIRLHGRAAAVLNGRGSAIDAARHGLLGYSAISAQDAVLLVLQGADSALSALEFETASQLCVEALGGPAQGLTPGARADLLLRLGRAQSLMGRLDEAEETWAKAAGLVRGTGDERRLAEIAIGTAPLGRVSTGSSQFRWELLSEVLERMGPGWSQLRLLVASEWLMEAALPHRRAVSPEFVVEVVKAANELGDPYALAAAYHIRHVMARAHRMPQGRELSDHLVEVAEGLGVGEWLFEGYLARLIDTAAEADGPGMDRALDQLRQTCATYRAPRAIWIFELAAATCARLRGEFEIAEEHGAAAAEIGGNLGIGDALPAVGAAAFLNAYHRGGLKELRTVLSDFADLVPEVAAWRFGVGLCDADDGDLDAARTTLVRGMEALPDEPEEIWLAGLCLAAELVGLVGADGSTIDRLSRLLVPYSGRLAIVGTLSSEFGPTDRCLGILSAARGDAERADHYFASAINFCDRLGARPWELRTRGDWIVVDRSAGRPARLWWNSVEPEMEALGLAGSMERLRRNFCGS